MTNETACVARGAALLDEKKPDWWRPENVNLDILNQADARRCVLGQNYGYYDQGLAALFGGERGFTISAQYGFSSRGTDETTPAWRAQIERRRQFHGNGLVSDVVDDSVVVNGSVKVGGKEIILPPDTPLDYLLKLVEANR